MMMFFDFQSAHEAPTYGVFSPFQFAPNDRRMVDVEFFGSFSCSCKRITYDDYSQLSLSPSSGQPLLLIFEALVFFAEILEPSLQLTLVSGSWAK